MINLDYRPASHLVACEYYCPPCNYWGRGGAGVEGTGVLQQVQKEESVYNFIGGQHLQV